MIRGVSGGDSEPRDYDAAADVFGAAAAARQMAVGDRSRLVHQVSTMGFKPNQRERGVEGHRAEVGDECRSDEDCSPQVAGRLLCTCDAQLAVPRNRLEDIARRDLAVNSALDMHQQCSVAGLLEDSMQIVCKNSCILETCKVASGTLPATKDYFTMARLVENTPWREAGDKAWYGYSIECQVEVRVEKLDISK